MLEAEGTLAGASTETWSEASRLEAGAAPADRPRYERSELIDIGGTAKVYRVLDHNLEREVVLKTPREDLPDTLWPLLWAEGSVTARLQHPGVVSIIERGRAPDGRPFLVMEEIRGQPLRALLERTDGPSLRRLVDALLSAASTVAYAHAQGVVHRDLKPDNIMVGALREVLVIDWGIAVSTSERAHASRGGTPRYMAPEQTRQVAPAPAVDVYALGVILSEILERAPSAPPDSLRRLAGAACAAAPDARPSATAFAEALAGWLDGEQRRADALALVDAARAQRLALDDLEARGETLRAEARAILAETSPAASPAGDDPDGERKLEAWRRLDEAAALEQQTEAARLEQLATLEAALSHSPELPEAHLALAERYREALRRSERDGDRLGALRASFQMCRHAERLPEAHPRRPDLLRWLRGDGVLSLRTAPPGARVTIHRYEERDRRRVPVPFAVETAPLDKLSLPGGSYLLTLRADGRADTRFPVAIGRAGPVGENGEAPPVWLPPTDAVGPGERHVPAGWFTSGGDRSVASATAARQVWVDDFAIWRFPVTNAQYAGFLNDLMARDREAEALEHVPRERGGASGGTGRMLYRRDGEGRFHVGGEADGVEQGPDHPVSWVTWLGACAFCAWLAEETGRPWRLPTGLEWEKAARGVDGRLYPWGDLMDPSFCHMGYSEGGLIEPRPVDSYPCDESPYGVRGMGGNCRDWCEDAIVWTGPLLRGREILWVATPKQSPSAGDTLRLVRGGSWGGNEQMCRIGTRSFYPARQRYSALGFRPARALSRDQ